MNGILCSHQHIEWKSNISYYLSVPAGITRNLPGTSFLGRLHDDKDTPMARSYQSKWDRVATGDCQIAASEFNYVDAM